MSSGVFASSLSKSSSKLRATAVDLFCGAGGLTRGLLDAGIRVACGYDIDPVCQFPYESNNGNATFHLKSVAELSGSELSKHYPAGHVKILVGCAPCQPFSKYTQGQSVSSDGKWSLASEFARLIAEMKPEIVSMENVPEIQRHEVFRSFVYKLKRLGYHVNYTEAYCPDHGVPQQRRRLVLLASLLGEIELVKPRRTDSTSVRDAIAHLAPLSAGESSVDPMHRACRLSPLNLRRIKASRPGGCWRDWPDELVADCHRTEMGKNYPSVYGRMQWDVPAPTITTQFFGFGNGRFGHPEQHRAITLREGAILQSFPPDYRFIPPDQDVSFSALGRLIGNAVPVRLGESIGRSIRLHLKAHSQ
jgi:DNA (cytosine-5)-methyltransferase 1